MKRDWEVALKPKKQKSNGPQHRLTDGMLKDHEILDCFPVYLRLQSVNIQCLIKLIIHMFIMQQIPMPIIVFKALYLQLIKAI